MATIIALASWLTKVRLSSTKAAINFMELAGKIVLAHRGYFNKVSEHIYRENSKELCEISSQKDYIGIIELDVRKSKDGLLYCYHGTPLQYLLTLKFPITFSTLKDKYGINSLQEILDVITDDKIVFLDLKSGAITKDDILNALKGRQYKGIILGNKSVSFLKKFSEMPKEFVKIMNGNIFCNFYDPQELQKDNFKYLEVVFPFQVRRRIIEKIHDNRMEFRCASLFFLSKESYWNKIHRYNIKHISSDFI